MTPPETITLTINGTPIEAPAGISLLNAADRAGIYIPRLCAHPDLPSPGSCGLCVIEIEGVGNSHLGCMTPAEDGMVVCTASRSLLVSRHEALSAILANHPHVCLTCPQRGGCDRIECTYGIPVSERCCVLLGRCELEKIALHLGIQDDTPPYASRSLPLIADQPAFDMDSNLCVGCERCVVACGERQGIGALELVATDGGFIIRPAAGTLKASGCVFCGACVEVCPTGALLERGPKGANWRAKTRQKLGLTPAPFPPEPWLTLGPGEVKAVPATEGVYQLADEGKEIILIAGAPNLRQALEGHQKGVDARVQGASYFSYEEHRLYTMRESELLQQFLQQHGCMPKGNEELDDLF